MLVELAAINAAIGTIKTTIAHGHDLSKAASSIAKFVTAEEDIRERANAKKNSMFSKLLGKDTGDFVISEIKNYFIDNGIDLDFIQINQSFEDLTEEN